MLYSTHSPISGMGLFSHLKISTGFRILPVVGRVCEFSSLSSDFIKSGKFHGINETQCLISPEVPTLFQFVNHSNTPNCKVDLHYGFLISLVDIPAGNELTIDYRLEPMPKWVRDIVNFEIFKK